MLWLILFKQGMGEKDYYEEYSQVSREELSYYPLNYQTESTLFPGCPCQSEGLKKELFSKLQCCGESSFSD